MSIRREHIMRLAQDLRAKAGVVAPPVDVHAIAKSVGAQVRPTEPGSDDLSGFLLRDAQSGTCIIGINKNHRSNRQRFTIAHEIGHLMLHPAQRIWVDSPGTGWAVNNRDEKSSEGTDQQEIEANLFAAELLMPRDFIEKDLAERKQIDLTDDRVLQRSAKRFGVSVQSLTFRLANLGFIRL